MDKSPLSVTTRRTIRLTKSEMGYYRALKKQKAAWDARLMAGGLFFGNGGEGFCQIGYEKNNIDAYDVLCARIAELRAKGTRR